MEMMINSDPLLSLSFTFLFYFPPLKFIFSPHFPDAKKHLFKELGRHFYARVLFFWCSFRFLVKSFGPFPPFSLVSDSIIHLGSSGSPQDVSICLIDFGRV